MKAKLGGALLCLTVLAWSLAAPAQAQIKYSDDNYTSMADASSSATIPPGTAITLQNWQQYKAFMPMGMVAGYSQQYGWKIGSEAKYMMNVAPTISAPMFKQLEENTEKYAGQAKLGKAASGGYTLEGYVAGIPFPKPSGELMPYQLLYDVWTFYFPSFSYYDDASNNIDRFRNNFFQGVDVAQWRMSHSSDDGFPTNPGYGKGILQASRYFLKYPEQVKYTTQLSHLPDDPEKVQEIYVFLPSLRRSLRLSSAARCSPILGSDWAQDDNGDGMFFQPPNFSAKVLGVKKVITMFHANQDAMYGGNIAGGEKLFDRTGMPGWPAPIIGKWEVRDAYVLDTQPLPVMGSYCYGHKVIFADKETFAQLYFDIYDNVGKFYKSELIWYTQLPVNDHEKYPVRGQNTEVMIDWQNTHATTSLITHRPLLNKACVALGDLCANVTNYAFPSGLSNIMR